MSIGRIVYWLRRTFEVITMCLQALDQVIGWIGENIEKPDEPVDEEPEYPGEEE